MIKGIIFDFGNVVCKFNKQSFFRRCPKSNRANITKLEKKFEIGGLSSGEFYKGVLQQATPTSYDAFVVAYIGIFRPIASSIELIKMLKPHYKLALLSNTNEILYNHYIVHCEVFSLFDVVSVSFKVHAMKPYKPIFDDVLQKLKLPPEQCLYIDDEKRNTDTGAMLGFHVHQYKTHKGLLCFLQKWGVRL